MTASPTPYRKQLLIALKAAIGLGVLALIFRQIGWENVAALLKTTNLGVFALACVWLALGLAAQALRWNEVMRALKPELGVRAAMVGTFESMFFSQILPSSVGGDLLRALRAYDSGATPGQSVLGVLVDRAFGLWFVAAVVMLAFLLGGSALTSSTPFKILAGIAAVVFGGAVTAVLIGAHVTKDMLPKWAGAFVTLFTAFSQVVRAVAPPLRLTVIMSVSTVFIGLALQACGRAIGVSLNLWDTLIILQGMMLASVIPLSIGGWGWREGAAVLLLAALNVNAAAATSMSVLFGLALTVIGLFGAVLWLLVGYERFDRSEGLKQLRRGTEATSDQPANSGRE